MKTSEHSFCSRTCIISAQQGDQKAKETIVGMYQPLLWSLARRLCCDWMGWEELVQAGNLGLLYALTRYNAERDVKLSTYAVPWILGEMRKVMKRMKETSISLDGVNGEDGQNLYDILIGCADVDIAQFDLKVALSKLEYEERILVCLRFFKDQTQKEAALLMGKSQAQISRIERKALDSLRGILM